jgi:hypothetical protein
MTIDKEEIKEWLVATILAIVGTGVFITAFLGIIEIAYRIGIK